MKLSDLINYKTLLENASAISLGKNVDREIEKITYLVKNESLQFENFSQTLEEKRQDIQQSFDAFEQDLNDLKHQIRLLVEQTEKHWFQESYKMFEQEMNNETLADIKFRKPKITEETENFFHARLRRYNGWTHPAIIIRPGFESYINELVGCDPLYLVDVKHEFFKPAVSAFNETYQKRLRTYAVNENYDQKILKHLPDNQFGLIFAYNFFNFRPLELLRHWLNECYEKLRPGGTLIITINDCDRTKGVLLVEQRYCCYTPGNMVTQLATSMGFENSFTWHDQGPSTWIELKKPGEYKSLRGGQALAKIIPK